MWAHCHQTRAFMSPGNSGLDLVLWVIDSAVDPCIAASGNIELRRGKRRCAASLPMYRGSGEPPAFAGAGFAAAEARVLLPWILIL